MREKFCSQNSIRVEENLFGTAPHRKRFLLIEYARPWGARAFEDSDLDDEVREYLKTCLSNKIFDKLLLIKKGKSQPGKINLFAVDNDEKNPSIRHFIIRDYADLPGINFETEQGEAFPGQLYFVCTNGKKDQCCAKFGLPVYKKLSILDEHVWQCAHIGGDRFAPNVFTMPYGHFYGHLHPDEAEHFYETTANRRIFFEKYRGRSCYTFAEQAAEHFLRKKLMDFDFRSMKLISNTKSGEHEYSIRFLHAPSQTIYQMVIRAQKSETPYYLTCKATKLSYFNILSLVSLTAEESDFSF